MRLLLDTHIMLSALAERLGAYGAAIEDALLSGRNELCVSVTSLWEVAIKWRLGKLALERPPTDHPELLPAFGITLLPLEARHVLVGYAPEPTTRDPFDRILLSICAADGFRLVTVDRALVPHPLAWQAVGE
jgi:PIN domain nuclease of toxin-antitoxin system